MNRRALWGIILIALGTIFLLQTYGLLGWSYWRFYAEYWPVLVILLGVSILLPKKLPVQIVFWLIVLLLPLAAAWFLDDDPIYRLPGTATHSRAQTVREPWVEGLQKARLKLDVDHAEITISSGPDLLLADLRYEGPPHRYQKDVDETSADFDFYIRTPSNAHNVLHYQLTEKVLWSIFVDSGATDSELDLSNLPVDELSIDTGASDLAVYFSDLSPESQVAINSGASDIELHIPEQIGVRLLISSPLTGKNLSGNWLKEEDALISSNYRQAASKMVITVNSGVAAVNIIHD